MRGYYFFLKLKGEAKPDHERQNSAQFHAAAGATASRERISAATAAWKRLDAAGRLLSLAAWV
jgi:hypothetical protein